MNWSHWPRPLVWSLALALTFGLLVLAWMLARQLALLFAAVVLAAAVAPIVERLERRMPRVPAAMLVYVALVLVAGALFWIVLPPLVGQARRALDQVPEWIRQSEAWLLQQAQQLTGVSADQLESQFGQWAAALVENAAQTLASLPLAILSSALELLLVVVISLYWLLTGPKLKGFVLSLVPPDERDKSSSVLAEMGETMGGFVRGTLLDAVIVGLLAYVGLLLIGVEFALVLALVAALGEFIPIVGPWLAGIPAVGIALIQSPFQAAIVALFYFLLQQFEGYVLVPNIMRQQAHVPPLLALFALMAGAALGGLLGALVAIPLSGALRVLVLRVAAPQVRAWSGARPGARASADTGEVGAAPRGRPGGDEGAGGRRFEAEVRGRGDAER